ncbi:MAG TPA: DNA gyrase inhibitor YacG, partial [Rhodospirillaceae bacterium]|nr:DNA gyrase inhibitor YacG [Rhodospirillaceae bacterium]
MAKSKCPMCSKETVHEFRPFCSKHCADVDLGRWFNGQYRIETEETP